MHSPAFSTAINQMRNVITPVHFMSLGALIYHDCCRKQCGWLRLSVQLSRPEGFEVNIQLKLGELFREVMLYKKKYPDCCEHKSKRSSYQHSFKWKSQSTNKRRRVALDYTREKTVGERAEKQIVRS